MIDLQTDGETQSFVASFSASHEDSEFFKHTPWGKLEFGTINAKAAERLIPGQDYFIDITPVVDTAITSVEVSNGD